jgi:DNA-binding CsgD family transcriptional regulator
LTRNELDVIEAAYRIEGEQRDWLRAVTSELYHQLGAGAGVYACEYQILAGERMSVGEEVRVDMPDATQLPIRDGLEALPVDFLRKTFVRTDCAPQSQFVNLNPDVKPFVDAFMTPLLRFGWRDVLCFGGIEPQGHGAYVGIWCPKPRCLAASARARWSRVAVHVVTALRLRARLTEASTGVEAILSPAGKLEHAESAAQMEAARNTLRTAVLDIERARSQLRHSDPDAAVASWKGLVASRWTLVDQFESDGRRFVVAHRNEAPSHGLAKLTSRERQVVAQAALGLNNKLIAYALGITSSTVSVLLMRCARKLGTNTRQELIAAYQRLSAAER